MKYDVNWRITLEDLESINRVIQGAYVEVDVGE